MARKRKDQDLAEDTGFRRKMKPRGAPFQKGESGNPSGRPKGARNRLSEKFIEELHDSFERNGAGVIEAVMWESPGEYLKQFGLEEGTQDAFVNCWLAISEGRA